MADPVWFWQRMVTPHMAGLATALSSTGRDVTYFAECEITADRKALGWERPQLANVALRFTPDPASIRDAVREAPDKSIHILQGFRSNGLIGLAGKELSQRALRRWIITEGVDDRGWRGVFKHLEYRRLIHRQRSRIEGVLAIGTRTASWLASHGLPEAKAYPFAYFLPGDTTVKINRDERQFRFLFIGRFIERKRVDMLIDALASLNSFEFDLTIVGAGPLQKILRRRAERALPGRVRWLCAKPSSQIRELMANADCLVLPSRHDGWGAVVSEALLSGTPVICSDRCGAAGANAASGFGAVFRSNDISAFSQCLASALARGRPEPPSRQKLANWAHRSISAKTGADYLCAILQHTSGLAPRPAIPWNHEPSI